jgi:hypothetical protein
MADAVAVSNIQRELTLRFGTKLTREGGSIAISIKGTYTASLES